MNASVQFAQNITCGSCHAAGTAATHINGSVSFGGSVSFAYTGGVAITETTFGSCGANACHNRGYYSAGAYVAPLVNPYSWNTTQTNCVTCHGDAAANMNTTPSHTAHLTTTTGGGGLCGDCHNTSGAAATHLNGSVNFGGTVITLDATYTGNRAGRRPRRRTAPAARTLPQQRAERTPDNNGAGGYTWGTAMGGVNTCTECHGDTAALMTTQAHANHLNGSVLFGRNITCTNCHGTNAQTATTHANGTVNFLAGGVSLHVRRAADAVVGANGGTFGAPAGPTPATTAARASRPGRRR